MNNLYNSQAASKALQELQRWVDDDKEYLHAFVKMPSWDTTHSLEFTSEPSSWRLVKTIGEEKEEVVFTIQAVLEAKDLPPILKDPKMPRNKLNMLHQTITLAGLSTETFENSLVAVQMMHSVFGRQFPEGRLMAWQSGQSSFGGGTLTLSNRYFTKKSESGQMQSAPFPSNVDPKNILTKLLNPSLIHTSENDVQYFLRHSDLGRNFKYIPANPQNFRIGDLVEAQFSLVVYKLRTDYYVLKPMLYSIALLDGKYANDLAMKSSLTSPSPSIGNVLKRKIGYAVESREKIQGEGRSEGDKRARIDGPVEAQSGFARMSLDE